ncbi:MAG: hypothetical protein ACKO5I_00110 [Ignavibacteria bacterium]
MRVLIAIILCCLCISDHPVLGQNARAPIGDEQVNISPFSFGIHALGGYNLHTASFTGFKGIPSCCPEYSQATNLGSSIGLSGSYALNQHLGIALRATFNGLGGDFSSDEIQYVRWQSGFATITHDLETSLGIAALEPQATLTFGRASLSGGLWIGMPLSMRFSQRETIFPGTFDGLNRIRNELSGDIPFTPSMIFGVSAGMSYAFPLNRTNNLRVAPEIRGFALLQELSESTSWKAIGIRAGLSLLWSDVEIIPPPPPPPPPIIAPLPDLLTTMSVKVQSRLSVDSVILTERIDRVIQPILPYVFFDEESSEIPIRYQLLNEQQSTQFNEQALMPLDMLGRYHHVLNLAGLRLRNDSSLTITIIGNSAGAGKERRNTGLAFKRAEKIALYLRTIWNIDSSRLIIKARGIPDNPSNNAYPEGIAENRRVELLFSNPEIFEVLTIMDSVLSVQPEEVNVHGKMISGTMVDRWRLSMMTDTNYLHESLGLHDTFISSSLHIDPSKLGKHKDSLRFRYNVVDTLGRSHTSSITIPIHYQYIFADKTINYSGTDRIKRYSLILFDFDAATLDDRNMRVIDAIKSTNGIQITSILGATDPFGDQERNAKLALERAGVVGTILNVDPLIVKGNSTYQGTSNALPEGRFYNRTVIIEAKEQ